jgi:hypothetical protein
MKLRKCTLLPKRNHVSAALFIYAALIFLGTPLLFEILSTIDFLRSEVRGYLSVGIIAWIIWNICDYDFRTIDGKKNFVLNAREVLILITRLLMIFSFMPFLDWFIQRSSPVSSIGAAVSILFVLLFWWLDRRLERTRSSVSNRMDGSLSLEQKKIGELKFANSELRRKLIDAEKNYKKAKETILELEQKSRADNENIGLDVKFSKVKQAFAKKYHPNNNHSEGIDKLVREEIFKEFWEEINNIENDD